VYIYFHVCGGNSAPKPGSFSGGSSPAPPTLSSYRGREAIARIAPTLLPTPTPSPTLTLAAQEQPAKLASSSTTTPPTPPTLWEDPL